MLDATGERLVPARQRGELVHAEHLVRYRLAAQLVTGLTVLDAACGEGYGTRMLADAGAQRVVGVDVDPAAVAHVAEHHEMEAVTADIGTLPFDDDTFDLVVSFETIEHVEDPEAALAEFARVLRPEGSLVISTPNADEYLVDNDFHVREFTHDEFVSMLERRFGRPRLLFQQNYLTSAVLDEPGLAEDSGSTGLDLETTKLEGRRAGTELYLIAVCGPLADAELRPQATLSGVHEAHELAERLTEAERTAARWHDEYEGASALVEEWNSRAVEAERLVSEWNARALEAERQLGEARGKVEKMEASTSWRLTRPLRASRSVTRRR
ncbi:MAG: class I SAM-dependent methyltransferase [Solirubrobacterales bacterium]